MQVQRVDIVPFVRKVMDNFEAVAEEHRIDFLFQTEKEHLYLWVDADKLERLYSICFPMHLNIRRMAR